MFMSVVFVFVFSVALATAAVFFLMRVGVFLLLSVPTQTLHGRSLRAGDGIATLHAGVTDVRLFAVGKGLTQSNENISWAQAIPRNQRTLFVIDQHSRALIDATLELHVEGILQQGIFLVFVGIPAVRKTRLNAFLVDV